VAIAIAAVLLGANGGGGGTSHLANTVRHHSGTAEKPSGLVRNATPQPGWKPNTGPVPILEYHVLGAPIPSAPYPELFVRRADFSQQMDWLDEHGYQAVTLEDPRLQRRLRHGRRPAHWPAVRPPRSGPERAYSLTGMPSAASRSFASRTR
jgi:hypothetical protein